MYIWWRGLIVFLAIVGIGWYLGMKDNLNRPTAVWGWQYGPYNTDPMEYDDIVHHMAWTSVFGTLVSTYKVGQISGQIAQSWSASNDFKSWSFKIKPECKFENGDLITPEIVANSLKRVALLQKKKGSQSGLFEDLTSLQELKNVTDSFPGITFDAQNIYLNFSKAKKDLLGKIGFGLYAIVHPSQYNDDGMWLDKKLAISSGAYKVENWSEEKLALTVNQRQLSCLQYAANPLKDIHISFGQNTLDTNIQEIVSGSSKSLMVDDSYEFLGPADSDILYIRVNKIFDSNINGVLRDVITAEMSGLTGISFELNKSFLPLTVKGVKAAEVAIHESKAVAALKGQLLVVPAYEPSKKSDKMESYLSFTDAFTKVMIILKEKYGMNITFLPLDYSANTIQDKSPFDMEMLLTGVIVENPYEDIRFMFKSKEGIQLPDRDGSIEPLLSHVEENIQQINEKIWEQGLVIPVTHYSSGLWVKKGRFDTKDLNHLLPATNFQFIGLSR